MTVCVVSRQLIMYSDLSVCLCVCSQFINAVRCVLYDSVCCQSSDDYVLGSVCLCAVNISMLSDVYCMTVCVVSCQIIMYLDLSVCLCVQQFIHAVRCVLYDSVCCQSSADYVLGSVCLTVCAVNISMLSDVYCMTVCVVSRQTIMYSDLSVCLCVQSVY